MNKRTGIAGYSGSGKSTVAQLLAGSGTAAVIIDADAEAKKFIAGNGQVIRQLITGFGPLIMENDRLNFHTLGTMVFRSREQLEKYNTIVHPPFLPKLKNLMERHGGSALVLDAALIPLWGIESWFDTCIWVHASFAARLLRVQARRRDLDPGSLSDRLRIQEEVMKEPFDKRWIRIENEERFEELACAVDRLRI